MSSPSHEFISDRGKARYFHGREDLLKTFEKCLKTTQQQKESSIFLIQGSPGAGKTALLHECSLWAKKATWEVVNLRTTDFSSGRFKKLFKRLQKPLLLVLDEAQNLIDLHTEKEKKILCSMENGKFRHPTILLLGGLNHTLSVLQSLGVSRLKNGCTHFLGSLDKEAEKRSFATGSFERVTLKMISPLGWMPSLVKPISGHNTSSFTSKRPWTVSSNMTERFPTRD